MLRPEIQRPTELPVNVAYVKAQAVVDFADDDDFLNESILDAVDYLDGYDGILGRALMDQTVVQKMPNFSDMRLPYGAATSITSVTYFDTLGVAQTVSAEDYILLNDQNGSRMHFLSDSQLPAVFDRPDAVVVTYQAGWATADDVPAPITKAIVMMISGWYENRTGMTDTGLKEAPYGVRDMLAPYRKDGV